VRPAPSAVGVARPALGALAVLLALGAPAAADELCADSTVDPVPASLRDGAFDAPRSACLRSDVEVRLAAGALIDEPDFYGTLGAELHVGIRFVEALGFEWGATVRVVDLTFAQTAVVSVTETSYGPVSLHGAAGRPLGPGLRLAGHARVELPFTREVLDPTSGGAQLAGLLTWAAHDRVALHGRAGLLGWLGASGGGTSTRGAGVISADAAVRALPWLRALAGLELQAGWYRGGVDHLAARAGAHWRVRGPWRVDLAALVPLAGHERTDLAFTLGLRRDR
jgi:hypothetical protein